jgi:hypothetical protein
MKNYLRYAALLLLLCVCLPSLAAKHTPLPDTVYSAKTIYIVNRTGYQEVMDEAQAQFSKWGRFSIAPDKSKADLVVTFTYDNNDGLNVIMTVTPLNSDDPVYQTTKRFAPGFKNRAPRLCIEEFKSRVEEKH